MMTQSLPAHRCSSQNYVPIKLIVFLQFKVTMFLTFPENFSKQTAQHRAETHRNSAVWHGTLLIHSLTCPKPSPP